MKLDVALTNPSKPSADYSILARPRQWQQLELGKSLNGEKRFSLVLSTHDPAAREVLALRRLVKARVRGVPFVHGPIITPEWGEPEKGYVRLSGIGWCEHKMQRHYLNATDTVVTNDYALDGRGLRLISHAAVLHAGYTAADVPGFGLVDGVRYDADVDEGVFMERSERGDNVWNTLLNAANFVGGSDFEVRYIDLAYDPDGLWAPGVYAQLDTYTRIGTDRSNEVIFHDGWGMQNSTGFKWLPDGSKTSNYAVVVSGDLTAISHKLPQQQEDGVLEYWDSTLTEIGSQDALKWKADAIVHSYGETPNFFQFEPVTEGAFAGRQPRKLYEWPVDYDTGDVIRVIAKDGYMPIQNLKARVVDIALRQEDANGQLRTVVTAVPHIEDDPDIGDGLV